jgi:hypothetical protein
VPGRYRIAIRCVRISDDVADTPRSVGTRRDLLGVAEITERELAEAADVSDLVAEGIVLKILLYGAADAPQGDRPSASLT